jgi:site-specific DNA recombinase
MTTKKSSNGTVTTAPEQVRGKRAFVYLRVSSEGQVNTGYDRDGLSIGAQREASEDKAASLGAEIVHEFSDPGKSAFVDLHKRTDFLEMLNELKRLNQRQATRIDYVIVWALNRWARNQLDHWRTRELVNQAGAKLISITEPMVGDDTPESFFMEGMFALNNQYESMKTGRNVSRGLQQKAKDGGTYGWARLGYLNDVERLPDGRQVASVSLDPERHPLLTLAFELFATGEYSLSKLVKELHFIGLRSRRTRRHQGGKVGTSTLHRILRDPYYAGWIVYKRGTPDEQVFRGRHDPLIDEDTFNRVQALLDEKRVAGERPQKHHHYLKGSVFCGDCGKRLAYGLTTGRNGRKYAYFFCASRVNGSRCGMRDNIRPKIIERAIDRYYIERPVQLTAEQVQQRTEAIEGLIAVSQQAVVQVKVAKTKLIDKLKAQQSRLLRLHVEEGDDISPDAFREERARLQAEIQAAEKSLATTEEQLSLDATVLRIALELAEDVAEVYRKGTKSLKRGYNQAFFKKLYVMPERDDDSGGLIVRVVDAELTEPYAVLLADELVPGVLAEAEAITKASESSEGSPEGLPSTDVSNFEVLAEGVGFEPTSALRRQQFSRLPRSTTPAPLRGFDPKLILRAGEVRLPAGRPRAQARGG